MHRIFLGIPTVEVGPCRPKSSIAVRSSHLGLALLVAAAAPSWAQQPSAPEVRQIVTFRFSSGRSAEAFRVYQERLKPLYEGISALQRFRGYREVESPEPLDLIVVSSYLGMEGMDRANQDFRRPGPTGESALALYGTLSAMTETHHDQFFEIIPSLSDSARGGGLTVFEYYRLAPGVDLAFERLLRTAVRPFERQRRLADWSTTGRMLVSDSWDYLRIYGIQSLGDWERRLTELRGSAFHRAFANTVAARKTIIVREVPEVAVR